jgi:hypothetical protein
MPIGGRLGDKIVLSPNPMVPPVRRLVPRTPDSPAQRRIGRACGTTTAMITAIIIHLGILAVLLAFIGAAFESGVRADDQLRDLSRSR